MKISLSSLAIGMAMLSPAFGIDLDLTRQTSVNNAMSTIAYDMMSYYKGNLTGQAPGRLPGPCTSDDCYYWWMAGGMWGTLINYYQYSGDPTYQQTVMQALAFQIGMDKNFIPANQSAHIYNEDAVFWALAAMDAFEAGVPNLNDGVTPPWIDLAKAVFESHAVSWDASTCGGGLRWAVFPFQAGYNIKTSISTGIFFQLAARLAWHTGNATYAAWADKAYDWMAASALMQTRNNTLYVWDLIDVAGNCSESQDFIWSYNYGTMMVGAATMYNYTNGNNTWRDRVNSVVDGAAIFFPKDHGGSILSEVTCESESTCNNDQSSFKAFTARWMAVTSILAPFTASQITPKLTASAQAAARQCSGGSNGRMCGRQWYGDEWDGTTGVGQQMSALAIIGATRINSSMIAHKTNVTGTPGSGSNSSNSSSLPVAQSRNDSTRMNSTFSSFNIAFALVMGFLVHNLL